MEARSRFDCIFRNSGHPLGSLRHLQSEKAHLHGGNWFNERYQVRLYTLRLGEQRSFRETFP